MSDAANSMSPLDPDFPIENLLHMLRSDDPDNRRRAVVALEKRNQGFLTSSRKDEPYDSVVIPILIDALSEPDVRLRRPVASTLTAYLDYPKVRTAFQAELREGFKRTLSDTSSVVRGIAIHALTKMREPSLVPDILTCWDDQDVSVHGATVSAMKELAPQAPVHFFIDALSDQRRSYRADAAMILGVMGDWAAVPELLAALRDDDPALRRSAMRALVVLGEQSAKPLLVADLVADLDKRETSVAVAAAKELGQLGDPAAIPGLVSMMGTLRPWSSYDTRTTRAAAAKALGALRNSAAVPALLLTLKDPDSFMRITAAKALAEIGDPRSLETLKTMLSDERTYDDHGALHSPAWHKTIGSVAQEATAKIEIAHALKTIRFSAYYPKEVVTHTWQSAHVYLFGIEAAELVGRDARTILGKHMGEYRSENETVKLHLPDKSVIKVTPQLEGFEFNPSYQLIEFRESWHRVDFRLRANNQYLRKASNGTITITVNGVIASDVPISIHVNPESQQGEPAEADYALAANSPYESIFCSYSHRDLDVVKRVEKVCKALGITYLRDEVVLKSGEYWNERLLEMIEQADVFQLFWSQHAADSDFVEQEWRHACKQGRQAERFIRPVYWTKPMTPPPGDLAHLHFAFAPEL